MNLPINLEKLILFEDILREKNPYVRDKSVLDNISIDKDKDDYFNIRKYTILFNSTRKPLYEFRSALDGYNDKYFQSQEKKTIKKQKNKSSRIPMAIATAAALCVTIVWSYAYFNFSFESIAKEYSYIQSSPTRGDKQSTWEQWLSMGDYSKIIDDYNKMNDKPQDAQSLLAVGSAYFNAGDYLLSIAIMDDLASYDDRYKHECYYNKSLAYIALGDKSSALITINKALADKDISSHYIFIELKDRLVHPLSRLVN